MSHHLSLLLILVITIQGLNSQNIEFDAIRKLREYKKLFEEFKEYRKSPEYQNRRLIGPGFIGGLEIEDQSLQENGDYFKCQTDLETLIFDLNEGIEYATDMDDAEGKEPSGMNEINLKWYGAYDQCKRAQKWQNDTLIFTGRFCWAEKFPFFRYGVCVPDSCTSTMMRNITGARVDECVDENVPWITGDYVTIGLCSVIALFLTIATIYDISQRYKNDQKIESNFNKITTMNKSYANGHAKVSINGDAQQPVIIVNVNEKSNGTVINDDKHNVYENPAFTDNTVILTAPPEEDAINNNPVYVEHNAVKDPVEHKGYDANEEVKHLDGESKQSKQKGLLHECIMAFSLLTNGESLFTFKPDSGPLGCLNGIRALSFGWVLLGHVVVFGFTTFDNIAIFWSVYLPTAEFMLVTAGVYSVDTFFFLSGMLLTYSTLKILRKQNGRLNWLVFYVHRYLRLSVLYGFVILLIATLWRHAVKSPFTNYVLDGRESTTNVVACQKYWWTNLLYINNFYPPYGGDPQQCHGVGWYMANDMQFFVMSPFFLALLYKYRLIGLIWAGFTILASMLANGIITMKYDLQGLNFGSEEMTEEESKMDWYTYTRPHYRMGVYFVGMITGELLLHKPPKYIVNHKYFKYLVGTVWILAIALHYTIIFCTYPVYANGGAGLDVKVDALINSLHRSLWGVSLGMMVYACYYGYGGPVNWFLSWRIWGPIARLSFAGYLFHPMAMMWLYLSLLQPIHLSNYTLAQNFIAVTVLTLAGSVILALAIEAPVIKLQKLLMKK